MLAALTLTVLLGTSEIPREVATRGRTIGERFVELSFWFGRDDRAIPGEDRTARAETADRLYERGMSFRWYGVATDAAGSVLCADPGLPLRRVVRIEGAYGGGRTAELSVGELFVDYNALRLLPKSPPEDPVPFVAFGKPAFKLGAPFYRVEVVLVSRDRYVQIVPERVELLPLGKTPAYRAFFGLPTEEDPFHGCVLLDRDGAAVGFQVEYDLWDGPDGLTTYNPAALTAGKKLSWRQWEGTCGRLETRVRRSVRRIQIFLRNVKEEDESDSWTYRDDDAGEKVVTRYGLAVPGGRFLVPVALDRRAVRQITRVTVSEGGAERTVPFVGSFLRWGALLVGGAEGVEPFAVRDDAAPCRGKMFLVHRVLERFGRLYQETDYNRYFNVRIGRGDIEILHPVKEIEEPAVLFDLAGELVGFYLTRKFLDSPTETSAWEQVVSVREIAGELLSPDDALDPLARPRPPKEERRPVWIGVEFQHVDRALMEVKKLLSATREGRVGLLVSHVYRDSPAARIGIEPGDILLRLQEEGRDRPTEFVNRRPWRRSSPLWGGSWGGSDFQEAEPYRIWRSRQNYLTALLTKIGPGKKVTLWWLRGEDERRAELLLTESPDDFDSADRWKDPALGLTVKDLTYEVRAALRLDAGAPGVVIAAVEPGGAAAVRQVRAYELVTHIDGEPLRSVADARRIVVAAAGETRGSLVLRLWAFGEARIVTIDLAPAAD
jgi:S1-C subfamily serine protease